MDVKSSGAIMLQRLFLSKNTQQNMEIAFLRRIKMKGFNKKVGLVAILILIAVTFNANATNNRNSFKSIKSFDEVTSIDINTVVRQYVPSKYVKAFNKATICEDGELATANMRLQILAIGYHESGWTKTICDKPNRDGSLDIGYLQLNSKNIKNEWFMERFGPDYETSDELELYLVTCINLYKALYSLYGEDAVYAYNAGETRYLKYKSGKSSLPKSTFTYKKCISKYTKDIFEEMCQAKTDREEMLANIKNTIYNIKKQQRQRENKIKIKSHLIYSHQSPIVINNDKKRKSIRVVLMDSGISTKRLSGALGPTRLVNKLITLVSSAIIV